MAGQVAFGVVPGEIRASEGHTPITPAIHRDDPWFWLRDDDRKDPAILAHLERDPRSPVTRNPLTAASLVVNRSLRDAIDERRAEIAAEVSLTIMTAAATATTVVDRHD